MRTLRDVSRDFEASGFIAAASNTEINAAAFALPTARIVTHGAAVRCGPYDLGCEQPSMLLLVRRIEEDAPRQRCVRE